MQRDLCVKRKRRRWRGDRDRLGESQASRWTVAMASDAVCVSESETLVTPSCPAMARARPLRTRVGRLPGGRRTSSSFQETPC